MPQSVANWLYQTLGVTLAQLERLLGSDAGFDYTGRYRSHEDFKPASGGQAVVFWGTELQARRDQMMSSYDYH